jgi:HAD superfamily hydrolase (TIGR01484 family)
MRPVADLSRDEALRLRGVLFDLDDTVLTHGLLSREAYDAIWALHDAGLELVAVTGRPSGWGAVLARQWPLEGCVTENGAVFVVRDGKGVALVDACSDGERTERRARLAGLVEEVRRRVPEAKLTDDAGARRSDVAWDIGERERPSEAAVRAVVAIAEQAGARVLRSSVHLHATFDADDKASGAVRFCAQRLSVDPGSARSCFAFAGDSSNDASCFAAFQTTFGVSNVRAFLARLPVTPRYVASLPMGEGFAEIARTVLRRRDKR